jgi:hypothetical protein
MTRSAGLTIVALLVAARVLNGRFVRLHMVDRSQPPEYEAMVFLGADSTNLVVAHWLDGFGAGPSPLAAELPRRHHP